MSKKKKRERELLNMTKVRSYVMLVLSNVIMELSNVRKKIMVPLNVTKVRSDVMLVLFNVTMKLSNIKKKIKKKIMYHRT